MSFVIDSFRGAYSFLSNFCRSPFVLDGVPYDNVEQWYQSSKTTDPIEAARIRRVSASDAKNLGQLCQLRTDWEGVKTEIMRRGVEAKFFQNPDLANLLKETRDALLIEGNRYHDTFWGKCYCLRHGGDGNNMLGQVLMQTRKELFKGDTNGQGIDFGRQ